MGVDAKRRVFSGPGYAVGQFECPPESRLWREENRIEIGPLFVFPSRAVEIEQAGHGPVVANPNHVIFYNHHQAYRRSLLDLDGDRCVFFWLPPAELQRILHDVGLVFSDDPLAPFMFSHGPGDPSTFLRHLTLARYVMRTRERDHLLVQESLLWLFRAVAERRAALSKARRRAPHRSARAERGMDERVREAQRILAVRYADNLSLADLGDAVDASPYHLARQFRRRVGSSIHAYRHRLRLLHALDRLQDPRARLVDIAVDVGFSSHSHFSQAFRLTLGQAPSRVRRRVIKGTAESPRPVT